MAAIHQILDAAEEHAAQERYDEALTLITEALQRAPSSLRGLKLYGACLLAAGQAEEALQALQGAMQIAPDDTGVAHDLGMAYKATGDLDAAKLTLEKALLADPERALTHHSLGTLSLDTGDFETAIKHLLIAIDLDPDNLASHLNLGNLFMRVGAVFDALEKFQDVLDKEPTSIEAKTNLCTIFHQLELHGQAMQIAEDLFLQRPRDLSAIAAFANALIHTGRFEDGIKRAEEALKIMPEFTPALEMKCIGLLFNGQPDEAVATMAKELQKDRSNPIAMTLMAQILTQAGRHEDALQIAMPLMLENTSAMMAIPLVRHNLCALGRYDDVVALHHSATRGDFASALAFLRDDVEDGETPSIEDTQVVPNPSDIQKVILPVETKPVETLVLSRFLAPRDGTAGPQVYAAEPIRPALGRMLDPDRIFDLAEINMAQPEPDTGVISAFAFSGPIADFRPENFQPYLRHDPSKDEFWRGSLEPLKRPLIGICWSRFPPGVRLHELNHFLRDMDCTPVSLIWDDLRAELDGYDTIIDAGAHLKSLDMVIDLIAQLDLVISDDSLPMHFAGALGKPGICLTLPNKPWYWQSHEGRSHWYPSIRVIDKRWEQGWHDVTDEVRDMCETLLSPPEQTQLN